MPANNSVACEVLTDLDEVSAIAAEWNALLAKSVCNLAFSSAQWFIAGARLNQRIQPNVIVARRNGNIAGILPLVLADRVASFPDDESDYNDVITAAEDYGAMTGLLDFALSARSGYRRLILSRLREDSNCIRAARILKAYRELDSVYTPDTTCPYIRLLPHYDEYLQTRTKSFRTSIRQAEVFAEHHDVRVDELEPETFPGESLAKIFLSLHLNRFAGHSSLENPIAQAFVCEVVPSLFAEGRLRAFALIEAESIVAINLCMVGAHSLCLWNGGFAATAERWSPGKLLINAGIRKAHALKLLEYDFLRGAETYKSRWANAARNIGELAFQIRMASARTV